jgi:foldase protein PrsA
MKSGGRKVKNIKKVISTALVGVFALSLIGCNMIEKTPEGIRKSTVAKVNGKKITRGEVDAELESVVKEVKEKYGENYEKNAEAKGVLKARRAIMLDLMIQERIMEDKAKEFNVMPTDEDIQKAYDEQVELMGGEENLEKLMTAYGMTVDEYNLNSKIATMVKNVKEEATKDVIVEEDEIKSYYAANQEQYTEQPNKMHLAEILLDNEDTANEVKAKLDEGADFTELAKEYSIDEGNKDNGGDLDFIEYTDTTKLSSMIMTAAKVLKEGQYTPPMQDTKGWHIVKVIEKEEYPVKPLDDVREDVEKVLKSQKSDELWFQLKDEWTKDAKIKKYEKNLE